MLSFPGYRFASLALCRYFWITDSCAHTVKAVTDREPFEILSLAAPIAAALQI